MADSEREQSVAEKVPNRGTVSRRRDRRREKSEREKNVSVKRWWIGLPLLLFCLTPFAMGHVHRPIRLLMERRRIANERIQFRVGQIYCTQIRDQNNLTTYAEPTCSAFIPPSALHGDYRVWGMPPTNPFTLPCFCSS
jgi:hypothetical protein